MKHNEKKKIQKPQRARLGSIMSELKLEDVKEEEENVVVPIKTKPGLISNVVLAE